MTDRNNTAHDPKHADLMDSVYRYTRHVYDASRKYFLLGRDRMISNIPVMPNQTIVEVGCGTARNLKRIAQLQPDARLAGLDASQAMLETARKNLDQAGLNDVPLIHAYADQLDPKAHLPADRQAVDHLVYSYCLTMIPPWRESLEHGWSLLPIGGTLNIVDFGTMKAWPDWVRQPFMKFLASFHVQPLDAIHEWAEGLPDDTASISRTEVGRGYAVITRVMRVG